MKQKGIFTWTVILITICTFILASRELNKPYPWYTNGDQDANLSQGTLLRNSGRSSEFYHHPSLGSYIVYGEILKVGKSLGLVKIDNFQELSQLEDPLPELANTLRFFRMVNILLAFIGAGICYALIFLLSSDAITSLLGASLWLWSGCLLQTLMLRSEFISCLFGLASVTFFLKSIVSGDKIIHKFLFLVLCGSTFAFAAGTKIQAYQFVPIFLGLYFFDQIKSAKNHFFGHIKHATPILITLMISFVVSVFFAAFIAHTNENFSSVVEFILKPVGKTALSANQYMGYRSQANSLSKLTYFSSQVGQYFAHYLPHIALTIVGIFLSQTFLKKRRIWISWTAIVFAMILFNSLRYYAPHYWIYLDLCFIAPILLIMRSGQGIFSIPKKDSSQWNGLFNIPSVRRAYYVAFCFLGFISYWEISTIYPTFNSSFRNNPDWFYRGVAPCASCENLWKVKYGSPEAFAKRAREL